jgi:hypothetical protein
MIELEKTLFLQRVSSVWLRRSGRFLTLIGLMDMLVMLLCWPKSTSGRWMGLK